MKNKQYLLLMIFLSGCAVETHQSPQVISTNNKHIYKIDQELTNYHTPYKKLKPNKKTKTFSKINKEKLLFELREDRPFYKDTVAAHKEAKTSQGFYLREK